MSDLQYIMCMTKGCVSARFRILLSTKNFTGEPQFIVICEKCEQPFNRALARQEQEKQENKQ